MKEQTLVKVSGRREFTFIFLDTSCKNKKSNTDPTSKCIIFVKFQLKRDKKNRMLKYELSDRAVIFHLNAYQVSKAKITCDLVERLMGI